MKKYRVFKTFVADEAISVKVQIKLCSIGYTPLSNEVYKKRIHFIFAFKTGKLTSNKDDIKYFNEHRNQFIDANKFLKMSNDEFILENKTTIEKIIELTDDFGILRDTVIFKNVFNSMTFESSIDTKAIKDWFLYPTLLQRAIEGWNKRKHSCCIFQYPTYLDVASINDLSHMFIYADFDSIDEAKEKALEYVLETDK